uniref:Putative evasin n=1 Tax=Amblyomma americanum TaxID=6943 RepID=A0A0C9R596_AMBAM
MIFLRTAALCVSILAVLLQQSRSTEYVCGPFCPPENVTLKSCVTLCTDLKEGFDIFSDPRQGLFRNGTPCWISGDEGGTRGQCCGDECEQKEACKSTMHKCWLDEKVRREAAAQEDDFWKRVAHRNITKPPSRAP